jgi:hypothetical protein
VQPNLPAADLEGAGGRHQCGDQAKDSPEFTRAAQKAFPAQPAQNQPAKSLEMGDRVTWHKKSVRWHKNLQWRAAVSGAAKKIKHQPQPNNPQTTQPCKCNLTALPKRAEPQPKSIQRQHTPNHEQSKKGRASKAHKPQ